MLDDFVDWVVVATVDVAVEKAARKHRWVRIARLISGLLFLAMLAGATYLTFKYS